MTASNQEGFEPHKPSGKQSKGPSMKERLIAQRRAEAEAAAKGADQAPKETAAPAPKKAAPKPVAKKPAAQPVRRGAAAKADATEDGAPKPARRASAARRSGGSSRASSRRRGGDDGEGEEGGGRRGRGKAPEKNMVPIFAGVAVVIVAAAAYFFMQGNDKVDEMPNQEQAAALEAAANKAKADEAADADAQRQADADAAAASDAAAAAAKKEADDAKKAAEAAKQDEPVDEGPPTVKRNSKGLQAVFADTPDELYDPNDPAEPQIADFELFGKADGCTDADWATIQESAAMLADIESGAAGTRAALSLEKDYGQQAVPALINVLLRLDYTTQQGHEAGDFVQRTLTRISNGRNADWRYGFDTEPNKTTINNRRTVNVWYGVWAKVVEDPTYWDRFAGQTEAAKREKAAPEPDSEPESDTDGLDDLLDDL
jgi:hypothetical protein